MGHGGYAPLPSVESVSLRNMARRTSPRLSTLRSTFVAIRTRMATSCAARLRHRAWPFGQEALHRRQWPSAVGGRHRRQPARVARHRQSRMEVALRHGHRELRRQLRQGRRSAVRPRAARLPRDQVPQDGMSLKKLQRTIMLSAVYQQSSKETPEEHVKDPLRTASTRTSPCSVSTPNSFVTRCSSSRAIWTSKGRRRSQRRSLASTTIAALSTRRSAASALTAFLQAFDFPNPTFTAEQRFSTNVPVQRLYFMNNALVSTRRRASWPSASTTKETTRPASPRPIACSTDERRHPRRTAGRARLPEEHAGEARIPCRTGAIDRVEAVLACVIQLERV